MCFRVANLKLDRIKIEFHLRQGELISDNEIVFLLIHG